MIIVAPGDILLKDQGVITFLGKDPMEHAGACVYSNKIYQII